MTFNAHRQKIKLKAHKKVVPKGNKPNANFELCNRSSMALKLSEINQKLWNKKSDQSDRNKIAKNASFVEGNDYRARIESAKSLIPYYI